MGQSTGIAKGILGFPVAPFTETGRLDEQALFENIRFLVEGGLDAIYIACGSGEFQSLDRAEYEVMLDTAFEAVAGKVPIYTGVGGNLRTAVELAAVSAEKGAAGYLLLPPYLIHGEQEGLYQYAKEIFDNAPTLDAILYQRDNAVYSIDTVRRLTAYPQLKGIKDGIGNMELNICLTQEFKGRVDFLNGMPMAEVTMPAYLPLGITTYSSAISNYIPHISRLYYESLLAGDQSTLDDLYADVILPINRIRKQRKGYAVALIKAGMEIIGLSTRGYVRPPVVPVTKEHYKEMEQILAKALEKYPQKQKTP
ncbi:5-dehydro-4-deoxyglucarate dehydratase [Terribacillus halophilus]|uniref:Probable 5-dehydro-4-deoxyglucarate dehydratase n=1 Tax=Terribacillus halophilus TaxID=361279 RepID=A0A1G6KQS4_9BACI|nr:5-dehydro-4-deoxyglucarate dehydratase [Terribacillus halophilus]SDC32686.1 5-dehydro-4-deoxyglucarate dehydratase [Terribacillus halophilus]